MSGFRAIYVPLIFLLPWIGVPAGLFFGKIKPTKEEWTKTLAARDAARGAYSSATDFKGLWPPEGQEQNAKFAAGAQDQQQDAAAVASRTAALEAELKVALAEKGKAQARLDAEIDAHMVGIDRDKFDYAKPDELMYELLYTQRDEEGPHLIKWLERNYQGLFFVFPINIPAPPFDPYRQPATGPEGRLEWPVGVRGIPMTVYGPLDELLEFVETFPDRYDRTAQLTGFQLAREAFDYRGKVLMRLDTTLHLFVWPNNPPAGGAAPQGGPGGPPGMPMMGSSGGGPMPLPGNPMPGPSGPPPGVGAGSGGGSAPADQ